MLELKELLSEYKSMPSLLNIPDPTQLTSATLSTYKRSSVADLKILYFNQMQTLHATIEGAAKFVPTTPGRHVVGEFENVLSLNAATYRIIQKVKFVVLDDAVLVAKRRRRAAGGAAADGGGSTVNEGKLVAEKCWPLNEMLVLDTKDSASKRSNNVLCNFPDRMFRYDQCIQGPPWQGDPCLPNRDPAREKADFNHVQTSRRGATAEKAKRERG